MSFFGVNVTNPFSTPVGQKIEQATDANLPSENWALNMEICDIINESEPTSAVKAIKRRLNQAAGKNYTVVMYTLTVLETCVKNCGKRFHAQVFTREFVSELVKLIGPKNEPPTAVQEKVLNLIQTWADTFKGQPHAQGVVQVYQELKSKGIEFPMTDLDAMAPIITPERSVPEVDAASQGAVAAAGATAATTSASPGPIQHNEPGPVLGCRAGQLIALNDQQMAKLRSELDLVHCNMRVFSEMLAAACSTGVNPQEKQTDRLLAEDLELLTELHNTCKAMQERVVDLIGKLAHDELTAELLQINDEMNNLFLRYSRFAKNTQAPTASALVAQAIGPAPASSSSAAHQKKLEAGDSLIDLSDDEAEAAGAVALPISAMSDLKLGDDKGDEKLRRKDEKDEFDAFAQSRTASFDATKNRQDEGMESTGARSKNSSDKTLTSSEFERFLAERTAAVASEMISSNSGSQVTAAATSGSSTGTVQRQIDKEKEEKSLFAL
ncbi:TOM1-like protein 2 [Copidosoma floridanum]|uniref:TOM1-like protein 2 n=1 Tax=Copidosoma floridanum TaxID=29053 RepID=UPI0006C9C766|nr:TOM1-like protein 2 [Copidosoma floridanum]XP_014219391.1 TOM1-like protein 2 [Copidosoma floridanum]